jgi:hypothetical protein
MNHMPEGGLTKPKDTFKRGRQIRVTDDYVDIPKLSLGMLGDATRHIDTRVDENGETWYRVEDVRDAAGDQWSQSTADLEGVAPVRKAKKDSVFHYTTKAGAEHILKGVGTRQSRAVQQLMD